MKIFSIVAIVATMLAGCTKEPEVNDNPTLPKFKTANLTVVAGADETRTYIDGAVQNGATTVKWSSDDQLILIPSWTLEGLDEFEDDNFIKSSSVSLNADNTVASFTFDNVPVSGDGIIVKYRAIMIYDNADEEMGYGDTLDYYLINNQDPSATSFDPRADVLIANPETIAVDENDPTKLHMNFARCVAINRMTIKGLDASEDVRAVSFSTYVSDATDTNAGVDIVGKVVPNYATGELTADNTASNYDNKRVTMVYDDELASNNGEFIVYFTTLPVELTKGFRVHVITDKRHFIKTIDFTDSESPVYGKTLTLALNKINAFSVNVADCIQEFDSNSSYKLLKNGETLKDGDKILIVSQKHNNKQYALAGAGDKVFNTIEVTVTNNEITNYAGATEITVGKSGDNYTFGLGGGNYLKCTSNDKKAYLESKSESSEWSITINNSNLANIEATESTQTRKYLRYNYNSGTDRFSCYVSAIAANQNEYVYIFRKVTVSEAPAIIINADNDVIEATYKAQNGLFTYTLENVADNDVEIVDYDQTVVTLATINTATKTVEYCLSTNTTDQVRDGQITIGSISNKMLLNKVKISQGTFVAPTVEFADEAKNTVVNNNATSAELPFTVENVVEEGVDEASASCDASWVTTVYVGGNKVYADFAPNTTSSERTATITLTYNYKWNDTIGEVTATATLTQCIVQSYNLVTSAPADWSGTYLIAYDNNVATGYNSKSLNSTTITISNNSIESNATTDSYAITIESLGSNKYSLKLKDGKYISYGSSGTNLASVADTSSNKAQWTITYNSDNTIAIVNVNSSRYIGWNNEDSKLFKAYVSTNIAGRPQPKLYKLSE